MLSQTLVLATLASLGAAQRPASTPVCDYYTTALFKDNTAENQYKLVSAVVFRAVTGNTTSTPTVNGIATPGTFMGQYVALAPFFTGALNSTNRGGSSGESVNFLDDGGPSAFLAGKPANTTMSNQHTLFTHLISYFGPLLGCTKYGMDGYPPYAGKKSQYEVHKFMALDEYEVGYFNEQVGLSAASFGVSESDVTAIGSALNSVFNVRCGPATTIIPQQGAQLESICIEPSCQLAANSSCSGYGEVIEPANVTMSDSNGTATATMSGMPASTTGSTTTTSHAAAASQMAVGAVLGAVALAFAL